MFSWCLSRTPGTTPSPDYWQGLLKLLSSKLAVKKRDCICEVFSSPHYCHVPTSHRWDPPYHVLYPDGISPALQETAKASGWREGCGSGGVAREGQGCNLPQWAYCQLESGQANPPLVSVPPTSIGTYTYTIGTMCIQYIHTVSVAVCTYSTYISVGVCTYTVCMYVHIPLQMHTLASCVN